MNTQQYLSQTSSSLESLQQSLKIRYNIHPNQLPLVVLNYDNILSPQNHPIVNECRGMVLELNSWNIVARGLPRFFKSNSTFDESHFSVETKEDGTYILLFQYNNQWLIATRHNFCEDVVPHDSTKTYQDIFLEACEITCLSELNSKLNSNYTYCLELCSKQNSIIQHYSSPTLFLLSIVETQTGKELPWNQIQEILPCWKRPQRWEGLNSIKQAKKLLATYSYENESIALEDRLRREGFVLRDTQNQRVKLKNPYYVLLHQLKYRGWIQATPQQLIPFILLWQEYEKDKTGGVEVLLTILKEYYECEWEWDQIQKRYKYCQTILQEAFEQLKQTWKELCCEKKGELSQKHKLYPLLELAQSITEEEQLHQLFKSNALILLQIYFDSSQQKSQFKNSVLPLEENHKFYKCGTLPLQENHGVASTKPVFDEKTQQYSVQCFCGQPMQLVRLKREMTYIKQCHCGKQFDTFSYKVGTLLWRCSTFPKCILNHEAHQQTRPNIPCKKGQPLGIPCSAMCKNLRMQVHVLMDEIQQKKKWTKSLCYDKIAEWLQIEKKQAHMALFTIDTCLLLLNRFERELK